MVSSLSERFRRAILSDDLITAKFIAKRAFAETSKDQQPFDIRNQTIIRSGDRQTSLASSSSSSSSDRIGCEGSHGTSSDGGTSSKVRLDHVCKEKSILVMSQCELLPALSASQHNYARQYRGGKDRNRLLGRCKSSLTLAIEGDASIELIQWLLDMGHETHDYSRDGRNCTMISLAAQQNRIDIIEALCTEAVANTASIHHQRHIEHDYNQRLRQHQQKKARYHHDDEFEGEEDDEHADHDNTNDSIDTSTLKIPSTAAKNIDHKSSQQKSLPPVPPRSTSQGRKASVGSSAAREAKGEDEEEGQDDDARLSREMYQLLNSPDDLGRTALTLASMKGFQDVVDKLLEIGSDINLPDFEGNTPLHYAAAYNHILIVQLLIERGCSFAIKNTVGFTAADYAYTSSLKSALEAFARTKHDRDRKQPIHEITPDQNSMPIIHKSKHKNHNPAKTMHHSAQHRLATQLRELHF